MIYLKVAFLIVLVAVVQSMELKGLKTIISLFTGDFLEQRFRSENDSSLSTSQGPLKGVSYYNFVDHIAHRYDNECSIHEVELQRSLTGRSDVKVPIVVNCIPNNSSNSTLLMPDTVKDIINLLKPVGNSTKRNVPGSCVLLLFYSRSCFPCARLAPVFNVLPKMFPEVTIAAIDAYKFYTFNAEFGIVGLPTILLFHQGRPIIKYHTDYGDLPKFIARHTGITVRLNISFTSEDLRGPLPIVAEESVDYYLLLAWGFIIVCAAVSFSKSALYKQIIEMIQRNWHESEAQLEHT